MDVRKKRERGQLSDEVLMSPTLHVYIYDTHYEVFHNQI
jgi:hypothetical protein